MTLFDKLTERVMLKTGAELRAAELPILESLCEILEDRLIEVEPIENDEILALAEKYSHLVKRNPAGIPFYTFDPNTLLIFAQNLIAKVSK